MITTDSVYRYSGTLTVGYESVDYICLEDGSHTFIITSTSAEISWQFLDLYGGKFTGGAPADDSFDTEGGFGVSRPHSFTHPPSVHLSSSVNRWHNCRRTVTAPHGLVPTDPAPYGATVQLDPDFASDESPVGRADAISNLVSNINPDFASDVTYAVPLPYVSSDPPAIGIQDSFIGTILTADGGQANGFFLSDLSPHASTFV